MIGCAMKTLHIENYRKPDIDGGNWQCYNYNTLARGCCYVSSGSLFLRILARFALPLWAQMKR
jgi:hypothetical protein